MEPKQEGVIESPIKNPLVTEEVINKIKEMTGATCVFLVLSDEPVEHVCKKGECTGHYMNIGGCGFSTPQILSIANEIAQPFGFDLVAKQDIEDEE